MKLDRLTIRHCILLTAIVLFACTAGMGQRMDAGRKQYLTVDFALSGLGLQYGQQPIGDRFGIGFRLGVTQVFALNNRVDVFIRVNYSQLGNSHLRVLPTGVLDTINVYNSLKIYQEEVRLHYVNTRIGLRKKVLSSASIDVAIGINAFSGLLLKARYKGRELQGTSMYNSNSISTYHKLNYGFEPELTAFVHLANGNYFLVTASYEIGISNIYKLNAPLVQGSSLSERTRALNLTVSFPIFSSKQARP